MPAYSRDNLLEALSRTVDSFRTAHVAYLLIGAWALAVWGRPRATLDLDFLVMVDEKELGRLGSIMTRADMELDKMWLKYNPMLRGLQLRLQFRGITIDLMRPRDAHDRQVFQRRQKKRLEGRYYWLVAAEDFILQKLKVGRPRDFEDALSVVERCGGKLNRVYLQKWARRVGVIGELNYIFSL